MADTEEQLKVKQRIKGIRDEILSLNRIMYSSSRAAKAKLLLMERENLKLRLIQLELDKLELGAKLELYDDALDGFGYDIIFPNGKQLSFTGQIDTRDKDTDLSFNLEVS